MIEHCVYWTGSTFLYCGISAVAAFYWFPSVNLRVGKRMAVNFVYVLTSATDQLLLNRHQKHALRQTAYSLFPTSHPRALYVVHTMEIQTHKKDFSMQM